jgi:hypothetical protein
MMVAVQTKLEGDSIVVDWGFSAKTGNSFEVQWKEEGASVYQTWQPTKETYRTVSTGLTMCKTYCFAVRTIDQCGKSEWSQPAC